MKSSWRLVGGRKRAGQAGEYTVGGCQDGGWKGSVGLGSRRFMVQGIEKGTISKS